MCVVDNNLSVLIQSISDGPEGFLLATGPIVAGHQVARLLQLKRDVTLAGALDPNQHYHFLIKEYFLSSWLKSRLFSSYKDAFLDPIFKEKTDLNASLLIIYFTTKMLSSMLFLIF